MEHSKPSQEQRVLAYMEEYGGITQLEAMNALGVMRLASRISGLKRKGHKITSQMVKVENRFGEKCRVKMYFVDDRKNYAERD